MEGACLLGTTGAFAEAEICHLGERCRGKALPMEGVDSFVIPGDLMSDEIWMRRALQLAKRAARRGEAPVGAVVVMGDEVVGRGGKPARTGQGRDGSRRRCWRCARPCRKVGAWQRPDGGEHLCDARAVVANVRRSNGLGASHPLGLWCARFQGWSRGKLV